MRSDREVLDPVTSTSTPMPATVERNAAPSRSRPSSTRASRRPAPSTARSGSGRRASRSSRARPARRCRPARCRSRASRRTRRGSRAARSSRGSRATTANPPTRPGLMLMIRPLPTCHHVLRPVERGDRLVEADRRLQPRCSSAWRTMSSHARGCSIIIRSEVVQRDERVDVVERVGVVGIGHQRRTRAQRLAGRAHERRRRSRA